MGSGMRLQALRMVDRDHAVMEFVTADGETRTYEMDVNAIPAGCQDPTVREGTNHPGLSRPGRDRQTVLREHHEAVGGAVRHHEVAVGGDIEPVRSVQRPLPERAYPAPVVVEGDQPTVAVICDQQPITNDLRVALEVEDPRPADRPQVPCRFVQCW